MRRIVFTILYLLGVPALFRFWHRNALTIVLYHGVAPRVDQGIYNYRGKFIRPETFDRQMRYLRTHYHVLPLDRALEFMREGTLPKNALAVTFDDGYRNFAEYAHPILAKYNVPATMFVATDFVYRNEPLWVDRLEYAIGRTDGTRTEKIALDAATRAKFKTLQPSIREHDLRNVEQISWTQFTDFSGDRAVYAPLAPETMRELQLHGVAFGAHTVTHPILSTLEASDQKREIEESKKSLTESGIRVSDAFAYPNGQPGDWNAATESALKDAGFLYALTTIEGTNNKTRHPYRLRRMVLDGTEQFSVFANVVSGVRSFLNSIRYAK